MPRLSLKKGNTSLSRTLQAYQAAVSEAAIVSITDKGGNIIYVNDKFIKISKYSAAELIGKTHRIINSGYHPDSFFKEMWQTIGSGKNWRGEIRNKAKDGSFYWVDTVIAPVLDEQGQVFQYLSIRNLITTQKENEEQLFRIQKELKKRNQLFQDAQQMARIGSWHLDISVNRLEWSDETYNIFEVPAGTLMTYEMFLEKVHPGDLNRVKQAWSNALTKGKYEIEHRIITKSGTKWVKEWARFLSDNSNNPVSATGTVQDITDKKKAEDELLRSGIAIEESERKFRAITTQATEGIALADAEGNYKFVNPAFCIMTGYTSEELLKMTVFDLTAKSQPHSVFFESKKEKERFPVEVNLRRKDGSEFMTEIIGTNIQIAGQEFVLGTVRDISERKNAEKKLLASEIRYRRLFEAAKDGILILNAETGAIEDVNPFLMEMLNYSHEEFIDKRLWEIGLFKDIASNKEKFAKLQEEGYIRYDNLPLSTREGKVIWVEFVSNKYDVNGMKMIQCNIRDITVRKEAEEKLAESEERYKDLVENITDLICTHSLDGRVLSLNAAAEKAIGVKFDPLDNLNIKDILVPKFKNDFNRYIAGILEYGHMHGLMQIRTKSGEVRFWEYNNSLKTTGKTPVVRGYAKDITDQKKAESAVRKNQIRFQAMVENLDSIISLVDEKFRITYCSPALERITGWSKKDKDSRGILDITHPDDIVMVKRNMEELLKKPGLLFPVSMRVKHKNGSEISLEGTAINLLHDKNINAIVINVRDVTERKKTEQQLVESEYRLRTIVQNEPECVKILNSKGELLSMNPAGLAMIEADHEEQILGQQMIGLIDPRYKNAFNQLSKQVFNGIPGKLEFAIRGLKGSYRWLETHAVPLRSSEGKIISLLGVTRDITERKKVEEEIRNTTEDLRQLAAHLQSIREEERKRIGREIHDELGQQLTAVKMDVAWIDKKITGDSPLLKSKINNVIRLLDESNQSVRRILSELRPVILDDRSLLESLEWLGRQLTANTGIVVRLTTDQNEIKLPEAISTCIFRICQEALTNVIRYSGALHVRISLSTHDNSVGVEIEDDGKGFDPSSVQGNKSFGILGMKERVLSLNGKFQLTSSPGKGTKIIISLPLPVNH